MSKKPCDYHIVINWGDDTITFEDDKPHKFWWEDMRRREIIILLEEIYKEGYELGLKKQKE